MVGPQPAMLVIVAAALVLFAWGRWQAELVAVVALLAAVLLGVVPAAEAAAGFGDPALLVIAAVAVVGATVRKSGIFTGLVRLIDNLPASLALRTGVASTLVSAASAFLNNADAAAAFLPAAQSTARETGRPLPFLLRTLALASVLGGTVTLVGSSANILVSAVQRRMGGGDFALFAFAPVGLVLTGVGLVLLVAFNRYLVPRSVRTADGDANLRDARFAGELLVVADSPLVGQTVAMLQSRSETRIQVLAVIREDFRRLTPQPDWPIEADDVLVLGCGPESLQSVIETFGLRIAGGAGLGNVDPEAIGVVEAVITPASELVGQSGASSRLEDRFGLGLLAIGRHGHLPPVRLRRVKCQPGDVLVLQGETGAMADTLALLGCLPLAERRLRLGRRRSFLVPALVLAVALAVAANGVVPIAVALLCGLAVLVLTRIVTLAELYGAVPWPTLILVGALLPLSTAIGQMGASEGLWHDGAVLLARLPGLGLVAAVLAATLVVTGAVRSVPAALLLAPLAFGAAAAGGFAPTPLLMAVAVGASCDLLAPTGGQARRSVVRFGVPLLVAVALVAPPTILLFWPLHP